MKNIPLSPQEKQHLTNIGITLKQLYQRYYNSKLRAERRGKHILPQYPFCRKFVQLLEKIATELNITPKEAFPKVEIHSPKGDYEDFVLMTKQAHHTLHQNLLKERADEVLQTGVITCRHCNKVKPLASFRTHGGSMIGYITTCKDCYNTRRRTIKKLRELA